MIIRRTWELRPEDLRRRDPRTVREDRVNRLLRLLLKRERRVRLLKAISYLFSFEGFKLIGDKLDCYVSLTLPCGD